MRAPEKLFAAILWGCAFAAAAFVSSCGGGAGYGGGATAPAGTPGSKLFTGDSFYVVSTNNPDPPAGQLPADRYFGGNFGSPPSLALERRTS